MKCIFFIIMVVISYSTFAQKNSEKKIAAEGIQKIEIISDDIFQINIISKAVEEITLNSKIQGEHFENIVVSTSIENGVFIIKTSYSPFYKPDNDKLAAHKLISVEVDLIIPINLEIYIKSQIASVNASGTFKNIEVGLENGNCTIDNFLGNANLQTKNGFINVLSKPNVSGRIISKHGNVKNKLPKIGKYLIKAESITGSILLQQTK